MKRNHCIFVFKSPDIYIKLPLCKFGLLNTLEIGFLAVEICGIEPPNILPTVVICKFLELKIKRSIFALLFSSRRGFN